MLVKFLDDSIFAVQKKVMEPGEVFNQTSSYDDIITMLDSNKRAGIYYYFFLILSESLLERNTNWRLGAYF